MHVEVTLTLAGETTPQAMAGLVEALDSHRFVPAPHNLDHGTAIAWLRARRDDLGRCVLVVSSETHGITLPAVTPDSVHDGIVAAGLDATWRFHRWGQGNEPWILLEIHLATGMREIYWESDSCAPFEPDEGARDAAHLAVRRALWAHRARIHSSPLLIGETAHRRLSERALFGTPPACYPR